MFTNKLAGGAYVALTIKLFEVIDPTHECQAASRAMFHQSKPVGSYSKENFDYRQPTIAEKGGKKLRSLLKGHPSRANTHDIPNCLDNLEQ